MHKDTEPCTQFQGVPRSPETQQKAPMQSMEPCQEPHPRGKLAAPALEQEVGG